MYNISLDNRNEEKKLLEFLNNNGLNYFVGLTKTASIDYFAIRKNRVARNFSILIEKIRTEVIEITNQIPFKIQVITKYDSYVMLLLDEKDKKIQLKGSGRLERINIYLKAEAKKWSDEMRDYDLTGIATIFYLNKSSIKKNSEEDTENTYQPIKEKTLNK